MKKNASQAVLKKKIINLKVSNLASKNRAGPIKIKKINLRSRKSDDFKVESNPTTMMFDLKPSERTSRQVS